MKIHNKGKARLFKSNYMEMLTKAPPLLIWGMYLPVIIYCIYYSIAGLHFSIGKTIAIFLLAGCFWTLFEYLAHRFIFHWISESKRIQKFAYVLHGNHHHYPRDRDRLFMPPVPSIIIASILFLIFHLVLHSHAFIFFAGFIFSYLVYASIHYAIHAFAPPFKWLKPLWRNHHLHHYKNEHRGFGVSNLFWDRVFGTRFDLAKEKEDKAKVQSLMFDKKEV